MLSLLAKAAATLALPVVALTVAPVVADAAPAGGGAALCVDGGADYSAVLQWPNRGGMETTVVEPGQCSAWGPDDRGELIVVLANYRGATINLGHWFGGGFYETAHAHGTFVAGTANFTVDF